MSNINYKRLAFEIIDFCSDTVYEKSVSILPFAVSAQSA